MRGLVLVAASIPFLLFGIFGISVAGPAILPLGLSLCGALAAAVGLYYCLWHLKFEKGRFIAYPFRREYGLKDVSTWRMGINADAEKGHQRHLELRFDSAFRTYILFEGDLTSNGFDNLLDLLSRK